MSCRHGCFGCQVEKNLAPFMAGFGLGVIWVALGVLWFVL